MFTIKLFILQSHAGGVGAVLLQEEDGGWRNLFSTQVRSWSCISCPTLRSRKSQLSRRLQHLPLRNRLRHSWDLLVFIEDLCLTFQLFQRRWQIWHGKDSLYLGTTAGKRVYVAEVRTNSNTYFKITRYEQTIYNDCKYLLMFFNEWLIGHTTAVFSLDYECSYSRDFVVLF